MVPEYLIRLLQQSTAPAVIIGVVGFLGAMYFRRRDENQREQLKESLAQQTEEFKASLEQRDLALNTRIRNEIETAFSKRLWVEQRMWDLKREMYFTLANGFHGISSDLCRLQDSGYLTREGATVEDERLIANINTTIANCGSLIGQAFIVLNGDTVDALMEFEEEVNRLTAQAEGSPDPSYCEHLNDAAKTAREIVIRAATKELMPPEVALAP